MLSLEIVRDIDRIRDIAPEWEAFTNAIENLSPFQLPEWQLTWWSHFGSGSLHVLVFRERARLAAVIPLFLHEWNGSKQLTLVGSGISDFLEPAIHPDHAAEVMQSLRNHLLASKEWDICDFQDLDGGTPFLRLQNSRELNIEFCPDTICSATRLTGTFEEFWNKRPKDLRRNQRRYTERALALGPLDFSVCDRPEIELLNALIDLHTKRWQKRGEPGMIAANRSADFVQNVAEGFADKQFLRFFTLRFRGKIVAIILAFLFRNKVFSYLSAIDVEHEILGFGRTLLHDAIAHCYEQQIEAWNFLRGDEPYKFSWGAQAIKKTRIRISRAALDEAATRAL